MKEKSYVLLLILAGFLVYIPSFFNGFVGDDFLQIVTNTSVHSLANFFHFFEGSTFSSGGSVLISGLYYRPLMLSLFAFVYSLFGALPFPYHFFQLLLHISNVILLFFFLRYFFKNIFSFIISLFFLLHPINSEAVLYSANLQDPLFFFFGLLSLLLIQMNDSRFRNTCFILLSFSLSLLAKESGILFLIIGIVYTRFFQSKKTFQVGFAASVSFFFYLFLKYDIAKMYLAQGSIAPIYRASFLSRMLNTPEIIFYYFRTLFFPFALGIDQYWMITKATLFDFYLPLLVCFSLILILFFGGMFLRRKKKKKLFLYYLYFFFWFFVGMCLHLQFVPLDATVADRWFYFPFVGFLGMAGVFLSAVNWKGLFLTKYRVILLYFVLGAFGLITFFRCFNWRDELSLYGHDITTTRENFILDNAYGTALITNGQFDLARPYVKRSLQEYPYYANFNNMAIISVSEKHYGQANAFFLEAVKKSNNYMVYENYSSFLLHYGDIMAAEHFTKQALVLFPQSYVLKSNLRQIAIKLDRGHK